MMSTKRTHQVEIESQAIIEANERNLELSRSIGSARATARATGVVGDKAR